MTYKKSHRDQKVKPYVFKAIENGCNILEIDIHSFFGVIVCGHYTPFFNCTLKQYLDRVPAGTIVQLDIKEICLTDFSRNIFSERVYKVIKNYYEIKFLVSANEGFGRPLTSDYVRDRAKMQYWENWKQNKIIEVIDLW